jgi:uncharacterized protein YjiK
MMVGGQSALGNETGRGGPVVLSARLRAPDERRATRVRTDAACLAVLIAVAVAGCRTGQKPEIGFRPVWDLSRAEILEWHADDPAFDQDRALEASGLAIDEDRLFVLSEKYARLLVIDMEQSMAARAIRLRVPRHSELEGIAVRSSIAYLCDEAHATVHEVDLSEIDQGWTLPTRRLHLQGLAVRGGKIGFEGVAVTPDARFLYLLLERSSRRDGGCESKVFRMRVTEDVLKAEGKPTLIALEDCSWRLTDLELWHGRLLALKSQFPGNRYEVISIDPDSRRWDSLLDLTDALRSVTEDGWGNNVEGLAVGLDGALFLVSDNAVTGVIDDPEPPLTDERTLLLRIPFAGVDSQPSVSQGVSSSVPR